MSTTHPGVPSRAPDRTTTNVTDPSSAATDPRQPPDRRRVTSQSVGQQRMVTLHGGRTDSLEISPSLWAGIGLVRGGAGTGRVVR